MIEVLWNKIEYALKDSQNVAGQLEEYSYSKGMQSALNGRTLNIIFWVGKFHMPPQYYKFSHVLCLNDFLHVLLLSNQRDQIPLLRYLNRGYEVFHLVMGRKLIGGY